MGFSNAIWDLDDDPDRNVEQHVAEHGATKQEVEEALHNPAGIESSLSSGRPTAFGEFQVNLAASAGISQGYLSQLEADEREPTLPIAARLARALGISLDELASGVA
jgi:DNA-binding XRE family transcriptional regulator